MLQYINAWISDFGIILGCASLRRFGGWRALRYPRVEFLSLSARIACDRGILLSKLRYLDSLRLRESSSVSHIFVCTSIHKPAKVYSQYRSTNRIFYAQVYSTPHYRVLGTTQKLERCSSIPLSTLLYSTLEREREREISLVLVVVL
jgi:hypothetical protein